MFVKPGAPSTDRPLQEQPPETQNGTTAALQLLGEALDARRADVVREMLARPRELGQDKDAVELRFAHAAVIATAAVARSITGERAQAATEEPQDAWISFGELCRQRALPLDEAIKCCLRWRDCVEGALRKIADEHALPHHVCTEALAILQRSLGLVLVEVAEAFESERRHTDEQRTRREEELAFKATHDPLTNLPNRALILDRLEQMLLRSRRSRASVAVLFIDLDDFKSVNDTLGHTAGDEVLRAVAERLAGVARDVDALGRLCGDEFVLLAAELSPGEVPALGQRVLDALSRPFELDEGKAEVSVTASIGIETGGHLSASELLLDADGAMYRAKWAGKNRCFMFKPDAERPERRARRSWRKRLPHLMPARAAGRARTKAGQPSRR